MSCLFITLNKCLKGHKSLGLLLECVLKMSLSLSIYFGHVMSSHHSEQMSQRSQVSRIALRRCSQNVFVNLFLVMSCLFITLNKCLKCHKSLGLLLGGVLKMSLSFSLCLSLSIFLVLSCLLITLNKCLKGHKSLGLLLGGVLKMSLSFSLSLFLYLYLSLSIFF